MTKEFSEQSNERLVIDKSQVNQTIEVTLCVESYNRFERKHTQYYVDGKIVPVVVDDRSCICHFTQKGGTLMLSIDLWVLGVNTSVSITDTTIAYVRKR